MEAVHIDEADICIVNTCTVTSTSDSKSLRLIRKAVKRPDQCVVATGCMMEGRDLDLSRLAGVRFIIKNKDKYKIPYLIDGIRDAECGIQDTKISCLKGHTRVFVKIQDGCDNACSYCKVRIARGCSRSRSIREILEESTALIRNGSKEIVLTGICLGAYGKDLSGGLNLSKLITAICKIGGDWRMRLSSIEPKDIGKGLIGELQSQKRLCRHLHIPFQSGDNTVLRKMNRPYTRSDYLNIVKRIKAAVPDIAISTDIMVGFPGETGKGFQHTLDFIKEVRPMRMHIFSFSKRKGTKAYNYKDDVSSHVKKEREERLLHLARELSSEFIERSVDRGLEVLVEDKRTKQGYLQGYTDTYIKVYIDGPDDLKGRLVRGKLSSQNNFTFEVLPKM